MKRHANILSAARRAVEQLADVIHRNERSFIRRTRANETDITDVHSIRIGPHEIDFVCVTYDGKHHQHWISFADFEDWLDTLDSK